MSKNIAELYAEVMSSQAATEKVASAGENNESAAFDRDFFEKVASGEEEAVGTLNAFIDEARANGHTDEAIEAAIGEAMSAAGVIENDEGGTVADGQDDEFEMAKAAAYAEGAEEAFAHVMSSDIVKTAGVTEQDLVEYELGLAKGQGYAETRASLEAVVEKIADAKVAALKDTLVKAKDSVVGGAKRFGQLMAGGKVINKQTGGRAGNSLNILMSKGKSKAKTEALKSLGARAGTAAGVGGVGAAGYMATRDRK